MNGLKLKRVLTVIRLMVGMWMMFFLLMKSLPAQDLASEHTQILNNIELITENLRQLQSVTNEIEMIKNQVEGLKSIRTYYNAFNASNDLRNRLNNLIQEGASLSNQTQVILKQMQEAAASLFNHGTMSNQNKSLGQGTMQIVQNALNHIKAQQASFQEEVDDVNSLMAKNNQAVGQTQALQTLNQLMGQMITQMQMTRELISQQINMQAALMNRENQEKQNMDQELDTIIHPIDKGQSSFDLGK